MDLKNIICKGKVVKKYQVSGKKFIDFDIWVKNEDGIRVAPGSATASLTCKRE